MRPLKAINKTCANLGGRLHLAAQGSDLGLGDLVSSRGVALTPSVTSHLTPAPIGAVSAADARHATTTTAAAATAARPLVRRARSTHTGGKLGHLGLKAGDLGFGAP